MAYLEQTLDNLEKKTKKQKTENMQGDNEGV